MSVIALLLSVFESEVSENISFLVESDDTLFISRLAAHPLIPIIAIKVAPSIIDFLFFCMIILHTPSICYLVKEASPQGRLSFIFLLGAEPLFQPAVPHRNDDQGQDGRRDQPTHDHHGQRFLDICT